MSYLDDIQDITVPRVPKGRTGGIDPITDARARVHALETGDKWECRRVQAWVDLSECLRRYSGGVGHNPCRECATIAPYIKCEEIMRKTPKPVIKTMTEAHAQTDLCPVQENQPTGMDPLDGLSLYKPLPRVLTSVTDQPYVHINKAAFSFSGQAVQKYRLHNYDTMSVFFDGQPGEITRLVVHLGGPVMRITHPKSTYAGRKVSAWGLVRNLRLEAFCGKRYALKELAPGYVEIDLQTVIDIPEWSKRAKKPEVAA